MILFFNSRNSINAEERIRFACFMSSLVLLKVGPWAAATHEFKEKLDNAMNVHIVQDEHIGIVINSVCGMYGEPSEELSSICKSFPSSDKLELKQIVQKCLVASGVPHEVQVEIMLSANNLLD